MGIVLIALVGILVGAVVNRLGTDLPARRSPQRPRCPFCGELRPWYHWVALPTYVVGRGRCPHCAAAIRVRYPLVELALGFLFAWLYLRYGPTVKFGFFAAYTTVFALVTVTDMERRLILNVVIFPAMVLAMLGSILGVTVFASGVPWRVALPNALVGGGVGYGFFLVAALLGNALIGRGALGGGDVKLAAFVGLVVGFPLIIEALTLTVLIGGVVMGFGWALGGFCPGTGIVAAGRGRKDAWFFILGGLVGAFIFTLQFGSLDAAGWMTDWLGGKATLVDTGAKGASPLLTGSWTPLLAMGIGAVLLAIGALLPLKPGKTD